MTLGLGWVDVLSALPKLSALPEVAAVLPDDAMAPTAGAAAAPPPSALASELTGSFPQLLTQAMDQAYGHALQVQQVGPNLHPMVRHECKLLLLHSGVHCLISRPHCATQSAADDRSGCTTLG